MSEADERVRSCLDRSAAITGDLVTGLNWRELELLDLIEAGSEKFSRSVVLDRVDDIAMHLARHREHLVEAATLVVEAEMVAAARGGDSVEVTGSARHSLGLVHRALETTEQKLRAAAAAGELTAVVPHEALHLLVAAREQASRTRVAMSLAARRTDSLGPRPEVRDHLRPGPTGHRDFGAR